MVTTTSLYEKCVSAIIKALLTDLLKKTPKIKYMSKVAVLDSLKVNLTGISSAIIGYYHTKSVYVEGPSITSASEAMISLCHHAKISHKIQVL